MLKDYLSSKNVIFVEKLVDQDEIAKSEMQLDSNGFLGVPFTVITNDNGNKESIIGFDKGKFDKLLS